jgi:hypothetical protein
MFVFEDVKSHEYWNLQGRLGLRTNCRLYNAALNLETNRPERFSRMKVNNLPYHQLISIFENELVCLIN